MRPKSLRRAPLRTVLVQVRHTKLDSGATATSKTQGGHSLALLRGGNPIFRGNRCPNCASIERMSRLRIALNGALHGVIDGPLAPNEQRVYDDVGKRNLTGRRELLRALGASGLAALVTSAVPLDGAATARVQKGSSKTLRVWVFSDAHVSRDKQYGKGLESLARALRQSESASGFDWDLALDLGDMCGDLGLPKDEEGAEQPGFRSVRELLEREPWACGFVAWRTYPHGSGRHLWREVPHRTPLEHHVHQCSRPNPLHDLPARLYSTELAADIHPR